MEPEPDFFAGAEAGEKEPAPACCCVRTKTRRMTRMSSSRRTMTRSSSRRTTARSTGNSIMTRTWRTRTKDENKEEEEE